MNKYLLLFVIASYLFIAISHIFYLPHYNTDNTRGPVFSNSIFKRHATTASNRTEAVYLNRTDKSTFDDKKKSFITGAQFATLVFWVLSFRLKFIKVHLSKYLSSPLVNLRYSYLNFCIFRI